MTSLSLPSSLKMAFPFESVCPPSFEGYRVRRNQGVAGGVVPAEVSGAWDPQEPGTGTGLWRVKADL